MKIAQIAPLYEAVPPSFYGGTKRIVALARRLAVIMHRMWVDGTEFRWTREVAVA